MIEFVYIICLLSMEWVLYVSGKRIDKTGKVFSRAGFFALMVYTLNEGLRYGRGIDYNLYYDRFRDISRGIELNMEPVFSFIMKLFIAFDLPFQALVLFMSFMFIWSLLTFMCNYKSLISLALPFFVIFSIYNVENMVRWYLAFSFFLFGLSYLLKKERLSWQFVSLSIIGCSIHYALLPVPIMFYFIFYLKKVIIKPYFSIPLFFCVYFFFETDIMMNFADLFNLLAETSGDRFSNYGRDVDYWLSGGFGGVEKSGKIGIVEMSFLAVLVVLGYQIIKFYDRKYIFSYNLFIIGYLMYPIAMKIELIERYDAVFFFFRAVVMAAIIKTYYIENKKHMMPVVRILCFIVLLLGPFRIVANVFTGKPQKYLYVWNKSGLTTDKIYQIWLEDK